MRGRFIRTWLVVLTVGVAAPIALAGCSGQSAPLTKEEKANFAGGPMPASARAEMQKRMQESRQRGPLGNPGGPTGR